MTPAPTSRRDDRAKAAPTMTAAKPRKSRMTDHRSEANGRSRVNHPIGDSHDNQPMPLASPPSPATRRRKRSPTKPTAIPRAAPAPSVSWAATPAAAANTSAAAAKPAPKAIAPRAGRPAPTSPTAISTPMTTPAPPDQQCSGQRSMPSQAPSSPAAPGGRSPLPHGCCG